MPPRHRRRRGTPARRLRAPTTAAAPKTAGRWVTTADGTVHYHDGEDAAANAPDQRQWRRRCNPLWSVVLPRGYPDSVAPEYIRYQVYDTLQEACGYFRGLLNTQAYLKGLGVGDAGTNPLKAVIVTLILAYPAMICGLLVGANPALVARLSADQKTFQFIKETLQFCGTTLALVATMFPNHFLAISCGSVAIDSVGTVIGAISRRPLIAHLARANNFAEFAAKVNNQARLLKLGLILVGYHYLVWVNAGATRVYSAFFFLSFLKIFWLWSSMRALELRTLNGQRLWLLLRSWFDADGNHENKNIMLSPAAVARRERLCVRGAVATYVTTITGRDGGGCADTQRRLEQHEAAGVSYVVVGPGRRVLAPPGGVPLGQRLLLFVQLHMGAEVPTEAVRRAADAFEEAARGAGWDTVNLLV